MKKQKNFIKITEDMLDEWEKAKQENPGIPFVALIDAYCGSGKTHAIQEFAEEHPDKSILMYEPRKHLLAQAQQLMEEQKNVTVATIQSLRYIKDKTVFLDDWDILVLDEAQSCVLDAAFNRDLCGILKSILSQDKIIIFLTGTDVNLGEFLEGYGVPYKAYKVKEKIDFLKNDTFSFIQKGFATVQVIAEKLAQNEKVLFFTGSIETVDYMLRYFEGETLAVISEYSDDYNRLCRSRKADIRELINTKCIPDKYKLVVATKAMDIGVSIHDDSLTTIIVDTLELATMRQMIGRKRLKEGEKIDLYVSLPNNASLSQTKRRMEELLDFYEMYTENPDAFRDKVDEKRIDANELVFSMGTRYKDSPNFQIDWPRLFYIRYMLSTTLRDPQVSAYRACVSHMLGCKGIVIPATGIKRLESLVGVKLRNKKEKMELIAALEKLFQTPKKINELLEEWKLPYRVKDKQYADLGVDANGKRKETNRAWVLERI